MMIEPRKPGDKKPPPMSAIWFHVRILRDSCPAARPIIAHLYEDSAATITHQVLWPTFRRAIEAVIADRGKGLSNDQVKYYANILRDWPFHGQRPKKQNTIYNLGLSTSLYDEAVKAADKDHISIAKFIRAAIEEKLARREAAK